MHLDLSHAAQADLDLLRRFSALPDLVAHFDSRLAPDDGGPFSLRHLAGFGVDAPSGPVAPRYVLRATQDLTEWWIGPPGRLQPFHDTTGSLGHLAILLALDGKQSAPLSNVYARVNTINKLLERRVRPLFPQLAKMLMVKSKRGRLWFPRPPELSDVIVEGPWSRSSQKAPKN